MRARPAAAALFLAVATLACGAALRPIDDSARIGSRSAADIELVLEEPCKILPGGAPMGRPDGVRSHLLEAGRYRALAQDDDGIYFASPSGILVTEPAPRGARTRAGGIYLPRDPALGASEYLGDSDGISARQRLPEGCRFAIEAKRAE